MNVLGNYDRLFANPAHAQSVLIRQRAGKNNVMLLGMIVLFVVICTLVKSVMMFVFNFGFLFGVLLFDIYIWHLSVPYLEHHFSAESFTNGLPVGHKSFGSRKNRDA